MFQDIPPWWYWWGTTAEFGIQGAHEKTSVRSVAPKAAAVVVAPTSYPDEDGSPGYADALAVLGKSVRDQHPSPIPPAAVLEGHEQKRAYVLLSYGQDTEQMCAVAAAALGCRRIAAESRYDVVIMRLGEAMGDHIVPHGVIQRIVDPPSTLESTSGAIPSPSCTQLTSQSIHLSSLWTPTCIRRPLTPLFDVAETLDTGYATGIGYASLWYVGYLRALTRQAGEFDARRNVPRCRALTGHFDSEMDWFNADKTVTDDMTLVSGFFTLLVGEFYPRDDIYRFWGKRLQRSPEEIYNHSYSIHFVAGWKPWSRGLGEAHGVETPELRRSFAEWKELRSHVCLWDPPPAP